MRELCINFFSVDMIALQELKMFSGEKQMIIMMMMMLIVDNIILLICLNILDTTNITECKTNPSHQAEDKGEYIFYEWLGRH